MAEDGARHRGLTLIAAETTGRASYGLELNPLYVDIAVQRLEAFTGKMAVLEGDGRTYDEIAAAPAAQAAAAGGSDAV